MFCRPSEVSLLKFRERKSMFRDWEEELAFSMREIAFLVERRILSSSWRFLLVVISF